jgi:hypothetical protein
MTNTEFVISHLRSQVRDLQSLLNYLESLEAVEHDDCRFIKTKLQDVIRHLKKTSQLSFGRNEATRGFTAHWLN